MLIVLVKVVGWWMELLVFVFVVLKYRFVVIVVVELLEELFGVSILLLVFF